MRERKRKNLSHTLFAAAVERRRKRSETETNVLFFEAKRTKGSF